MSQMINKKECRFAVYVPPPEHGMPDLHVIKEQIHHTNPDGSITLKPHLQFVYNFERKFWISKKGYQDHKEKKECEYLDRLIEFKSTQSKLVENIAKALGTPWF